MSELTCSFDLIKESTSYVEEKRRVQRREATNSTVNLKQPVFHSQCSTVFHSVPQSVFHSQCSTVFHSVPQCSTVSVPQSVFHSVPQCSTVSVPHRPHSFSSRSYMESLASISRSTLAQCERQRDELREQLEECRRRAAEQESRQQDLRVELLKHRQKTAKWEEEKTWWAARYVHFEKTIKALEAELESAHQESGRLNEQLQEKSETIVDLNEKLQQSDAEVQKVKGMILNLQRFQTALTDQEAVHRNCRRDLEAADKEHEQRRTEIINEHRKEMEKKQEVHEAEMAKAQQLAEETRKKLQRSIDGFSAENKRLLSHISKTEEELAKTNKSSVQTARELDLSKARLAKAQDEAENNKERVEKVRIKCLMTKMATGALIAEKDAAIRDREDEMERLKYTLYVRDMELEDAHATAKPQEVTGALQEVAQEVMAALQEVPQEVPQDEENEIRIPEKRLKQLLSAETSISFYAETEKALKKELKRLRSVVKAQDAQIRHFKEYVERFKSDVHHCISTMSNKKLFGARYQKLRARYIECTDTSLLPEQVCAPVLKKLEEKVEKSRRWMQRYQACLADCLAVTWNPFEFKDKVVALNDFVKFKDPLDPWDDEPRAMQSLLQVEQALKKEIQRVKRDFRQRSKTQSDLISQLNEGRLEIVHLKEELQETKKQLGKTSLEACELNEELQATRTQLEKFTRPAHKKVQSWFHKNVLKRPRLNQVGVEPPATSPMDEYEYSAGSPWGPGDSLWGPGDSPGASSTEARDLILTQLFSVSTP
ncbi:uncharacterized protein V6R79_000697 [Siganus canaliculatus]